jgi:alpha-tubulin suppressor-like RCC1 family protein
MKRGKGIKINFSNKFIYTIVGLLVLGITAGFVIADSSISFGHLAEEVYILISGSRMNLQEAYDTGNLGGDTNIFGTGEGLSGARIVDLAYTGVGNAFCVIKEGAGGNRVSCSGYNAHGELGLGDTMTRITFKENPALVDVTKLTAGMLSFCALYQENGKGQVKCWGYNAYGQCGVGNFNNGIYVPTKVKGLDNEDIIDVQIRRASGYYESTCALTASGKIYCWGYNNGHGILGNGGTDNKNVPTLVSGITNAINFSMGGHNSGGYTCALLADKTVKCWGYNGYSQLGTGNTNSQKTPVFVKEGSNNLGGVKAIVLSPDDYGTSCVLLEDGRIKCWGYNVYGQLGSGNDADRSVANPVLVSGIGGTNPKAVKIVSSGSASASSFCALLEDKTVKCWGYNYYGNIGLGEHDANLPGYGCRGISNSRCYKSPSTVPNLQNIKDIQLSGWSSDGSGCALKEDGNVLCWGRNQYGQLGVGDTTTRYTPVAISLVGHPVKKLALSVENGGISGKNYYSNAVILEDKSIRVWGRNAYGGLGTGDKLSYVIPVMPL